MKIEVGQELWFVADKYRNNLVNHAVIVEKVGRKFATLSSVYFRTNHKMNMTSMEVVSESGRLGMCYLSKEEYDFELQRYDSYFTMMSILDKRTDLSLRQINKILEIIAE